MSAEYLAESFPSECGDLQAIMEAAGIEPARHSLPNSALSRQEVCMCDAEDVETGEHVGWIACPESLCERPDHVHAQEAN